MVDLMSCIKPVAYVPIWNEHGKYYVYIYIYVYIN